MEEKREIPERTKDLASVAIVSFFILIILIIVKTFSGIPYCPDNTDREILAATELYLLERYGEYEINYKAQKYETLDDIPEGIRTIPRRNCINYVATYYLTTNISNGTIVLQINGTTSGFEIAE